MEIQKLSSILHFADNFIFLYQFRPGQVETTINILKEKKWKKTVVIVQLGTEPSADDQNADIHDAFNKYFDENLKPKSAQLLMIK